MKIINVIEMIENSIINIESFVVINDELLEETFEQAEDLFKQMAIENGANKDKMEEYLAKPACYINNDYCLRMIWSYPENVQI